MDKDTVIEILDLLREEYPEAGCALDHMDPFQLLVAVAEALAQATPEDVA